MELEHRTYAVEQELLLVALSRSGAATSGGLSCGGRDTRCRPTCDACRIEWAAHNESRCQTVPHAKETTRCITGNIVPDDVPDISESAWQTADTWRVGKANIGGCNKLVGQQPVYWISEFSNKGNAVNIGHHHASVAIDGYGERQWADWKDASRPGNGQVFNACVLSRKRCCGFISGSTTTGTAATTG